MTDKESVLPVMGKVEAPTHSVDYYYMEAMRYLTCTDHHSDDSDGDGARSLCNCQRCRQNSQGESQSHSSGSIDKSNAGDDDDIDSNNNNGGPRERAWSHSIGDDYESSSVLPQLPSIEGKFVPGGRMKTRRYSDGMLLNQNLKVTNGRVHWADDCQKELTRCRPRKKYTRNPTLKPPPVRSILKNSEENVSNLTSSEEEDDS